MKYLITVSLILIFSVTSYGDDTIHVFSKNKIVDDVSSCSMEKFKTPLIYVSSSTSRKAPHYENFRARGSSRAKILGRLPVGSLIRVNKGQSLKPGQKGYLFVQVAKNAQPKSKFSHIITKTSKGFLWAPSVEAPDSWAFKVLRSTISGESGNDRFYLNDKFLRVVKSGSYYSGIQCCEGTSCSNHILFSVSETLNGEVLSFIAVKPSEMSFIQRLIAEKVKTPVKASKPTLKVVAQPSSRKVIPRRSADTTKPKSNVVQPVKTYEGSVTKVVCTRGGRLNVRNDKLAYSFKAKKYEEITPYESWTTNRKKKGKHTYVKVKFTERNKVGWVAENYIKVGSECPGYRAQNSKPVIVAKPQSKVRSAASKVKNLLKRVADRGLATGAMSPVASGEETFLFPLLKTPTVSYVGNGTSFGWRRSGGKRKHAACDLKRPPGDSIRSVESGTVLRSYYFYSGTNAVEVMLDNGEVVRYGEISKKSLVKRGDRIEKGHVLAKVGRLNSGNSMLHFELYSGEQKGRLTTNINKYKRRKDLLNPTKRLKAWQKQSLR